MCFFLIIIKLGQFSNDVPFSIFFFVTFAVHKIDADVFMELGVDNVRKLIPLEGDLLKFQKNFEKLIVMSPADENVRGFELFLSLLSLFDF